MPYFHQMLKRTIPPTLPAGERESLEDWLEFHRTTSLMKRDGLAPDQLVIASCSPFGLSLMAPVRHLTGVEPLVSQL
jgi:hypothetical protein